MRNATILVCLLLLGFLLGMPSPALAFQVKQFSVNAYLGQPIHEDITTEALKNYRVNGVDGRFTDEAINQIVSSNAETDKYQSDSALHFDGENFSGGSKRLKDLKEEIIREVEGRAQSRSKSTYTSYRKLGTALHTVQDFYAHSNWVELHKDSPEINTDLGRKIFAGADENTPTCPTNSSTLDGEGLHLLTSGYYKNSTSCSLPDGVKPGKCIHGPVLNPTCSGINKDKPGRPGYDTARTLAVKATEDYLDQILKEPPLKGNVDAAKFLMGIK